MKLKDKIVEFYKKQADKVVHKDVGAWLIVPLFFCQLFSIFFWVWVGVAILLPLLNELYDKYSKNGSGWSNADIVATYVGEVKMVGLLICLFIFRL